MKIKILKGTVGMFGYSYDEGDRADLADEVALKMIEAGYAEADKEESEKPQAQPDKKKK